MNISNSSDGKNKSHFHSDRPKSSEHNESPVSHDNRNGSVSHNRRNQVDIKLFVGQIPKTWDENELKIYFGKYDEILKVQIIRDKNNQHKGCAFVVFASILRANSAIKALESTRLPGMQNVVQIRWADNEPDRLGLRQDQDHILYVAQLPKSIIEREIREKFEAFGRVREVDIPRDSQGLSRGFVFVKFENIEQSILAKQAMNDKYPFNHQTKPLVVKFYDPKKKTQKDGENEANQNRERWDNKVESQSSNTQSERWENNARSERFSESRGETRQQSEKWGENERRGGERRQEGRTEKWNENKNERWEEKWGGRAEEGRPSQSSQYNRDRYAGSTFSQTQYSSANQGTSSSLNYQREQTPALVPSGYRGNQGQQNYTSSVDTSYSTQPYRVVEQGGDGYEARGYKSGDRERERSRSSRFTENTERDHQNRYSGVPTSVPSQRVQTLPYKQGAQQNSNVDQYRNNPPYNPIMKTEPPINQTQQPAVVPTHYPNSYKGPVQNINQPEYGRVPAAKPLQAPYDYQNMQTQYRDNGQTPYNEQQRPLYQQTAPQQSHLQNQQPYQYREAHYNGEYPPQNTQPLASQFPPQEAPVVMVQDIEPFLHSSKVSVWQLQEKIYYRYFTQDKIPYYYDTVTQQTQYEMPPSGSIIFNPDGSQEHVQPESIEQLKYQQEIGGQDLKELEILSNDTKKNQF